MNLKLVLQLSVFGLVMAVATVFVEPKTDVDLLARKVGDLLWGEINSTETRGPAVSHYFLSARFIIVLRKCSTLRFSHQNCNAIRNPWIIFHNRSAIT